MPIAFNNAALFTNRVTFTCNLIRDFGSKGLPRLPQLRILGLTSNLLPASERLQVVLKHLLDTCPALESLYFVGNPCVSDLHGELILGLLRTKLFFITAYRIAVPKMFPQLRLLDGVTVTSEGGAATPQVV